ncbi:MAG TPA: MFS transporter, partial [Rhodobacter sp.]|nr:MFS transporter [Rhodobacter sp.]
MMGTPLAGVLAIAMAPVIAPLLGRFSLPLSVFFLAIAASLVGLSHNLAVFAGAMMLLGAATGNADVLMNARVSMMENQTGTSLMNLS